MQAITAFLLRHGYPVLFVWVFAEQSGVPVPSIPALLAAGALAGTGRLNFAAALGGAVAVTLCADLLWYALGRSRGIKILQFLCRIALEPDSCVRRTEGLYQRHGARSLLVAKFLPGLSTAAPPLAGVFRMKPARFLLFDFAGAAFWAGSWLGLGFASSGAMEKAAGAADRLGGGLLVVLVVLLAGYLGFRLAWRRRFLRELRIARITPEDLKRKLDAGEDLVVVDLRHSMDFEADPQTIPGAFHMDADDLEAEGELLPPGREVILYCT